MYFMYMYFQNMLLNKYLVNFRTGSGITPHFMYPVLQLSEVAQALVVYELGAIIQPPDHYNIREVYQYSDKATPTLFVYPDNPEGTQGTDSTKGKEDSVLSFLPLCP